MGPLPFAQYAEHDALGLAERVRRREVSAAELVETAIARAEEVDGRVNAVVARAWDRARKAASGPLAGPFAGVPFLLKDLLLSEAGVPTTHGSRYFREVALDHDSELVARQRRAGLIFLGKTNTSELGLLPVTEPALHGPTRNPWDLSRTAGGSSGGAAAAVAAGIVPMAHASDGGGSIRIPASCCGLFGLKPTRARTPCGPDFGEGWHGLSVDHCVSRSVRDSAALLDATHGPDPGAPYAAPPPERPYLDELAREPGRLRIALVEESLFGTTMHADCRAAVRDAAALCASLGHEVEPANPALDAPALARAYLVLAAAETAAALDDATRALGRAPRDEELEPVTHFFAQAGRVYTAAELAQAVHVVHVAGRAAARFFATRDLLLLPTLAQPPVGIGTLRANALELAGLALLRRAPVAPAIRRGLDLLAARGFEFAGTTPLANLTGQPAMNVPLFWSEAGLPIGVQFVGRFGDEATLLRLAAQLETARPWAGRRPPL